MSPLLKTLPWHPHLIRMKCKLLFWSSSPFLSLSISHLLFQPLSPLLPVLQILCSDFVLSVHQTCPTLLNPGLLDGRSSLCLEGCLKLYSIFLISSRSLSRVPSKRGFPDYWDFSSLLFCGSPLPSVILVLQTRFSLVCYPSCYLLVSQLKARILPIISLLLPLDLSWYLPHRRQLNEPCLSG